MQRLRTTFKRSRTPTGAEMKTQSSLEVPKQVRSASFDEIQLEAKRQQSTGQSAELLKVPQYASQQRSRSVDSGGTEESGNYLEVPTRRFQRRRSSGSKSPVCVHCVCLEEYARLHVSDEPLPQPQDEQPLPRAFFVSDSSSECDEEVVPDCSITISLSPTLSPTLPSPPIRSPPPASPSIEFFPADGGAAPVRRKSIHRQEAFFTEPSGISLENISDGQSEAGCSDGTSDCDTSTVAISGLVVRDIYLQVPDLKRDRAASVDSCFSKVSQGKTEELQHSGVSLEVPVGPNVALRSRSVDIVLPTDEQARYKALAMAAPAVGSAESYYKPGYV